MSNRERHLFDILLAPRSLIVVGASPIPRSTGTWWFRVSTGSGSPGESTTTSSMRTGRSSWDDSPMRASRRSHGGSGSNDHRRPGGSCAGSIEQCGGKGVSRDRDLGEAPTNSTRRKETRLYGGDAGRRRAASYPHHRTEHLGVLSPQVSFNGSFSPDFSVALPGRIALVARAAG